MDQKHHGLTNIIHLTLKMTSAKVVETLHNTELLLLLGSNHLLLCDSEKKTVEICSQEICPKSIKSGFQVSVVNPKQELSL